MWNPSLIEKRAHPQRFFLIAGPCVIESPEIVFEVACKMKEICEQLNIQYIFKASLDKANRSSHSSYRGLGFEKGLAILEEVRSKYALPVITDIHETAGVAEIASVVDVLQIPAFLCRQTNLIAAAMAQGCPVNIKKGQFLSPWDMQTLLDKARSFSDSPVWLCERGSTFGYNNLVVDMRSLAVMGGLGVPVIFDATHAVQLPGGLGHASSGQREFIPPLARAAVAVGVEGLFMETHPKPDEALSDGPNSVPLDQMYDLLHTLVQVSDVMTQNVLPRESESLIDA